MEMSLNIGTSGYGLTHYQTVAKETVEVVEAQGISLAFGGHRVLDSLSFNLPAASATLLRGENGSGKTTLLNVINGFIRLDKGTLTINLHHKKNIFSCKFTPEQVARAGVGRLWQDIRLFPTMTALDNVLAATPRFANGNLLTALATLPAWRRDEQTAYERALHHLDMVNMADRAQSSCDMLSVGQMKRVAIARLLQAEAELLLLDEPLAGLDRDSANSLLDLLARLREKHGKTMLIVEHQHEHMLPVCDRSFILADGKLTVQEAD